MTKPLFVIVHEGCVPVKSPQKKEIERIKREERWTSASDNLSLKQAEIHEKNFVYICGAYTLQCVSEYFSKLKEARGHRKGTFFWEPATISIEEAVTYLQN